MPVSPVVVAASVVGLAAALAGAFLWRKRPWSRILALAVTIICFQVTLMVFPPLSAVVGEEHRIDWEGMITDILGRVMFSVLLVSGVQGRWIWKTSARIVSGPWDGNEDNAPE